MTEKHTEKKQFKVSNGNFESIKISAIFEIDFDFPKVKERIVEMSTFWSGSPSKDAPLEEHINYILPIATSTIYHANENNVILDSTEKLDERLWQNEEGFAYGEYIGIKLIDFYADNINADIFEVEEI